MRAVAIRRAKSGLLGDDELQQLMTERMDEDMAFWTTASRSRAVITVEVDEGHVTLAGLVPTGADRRRADILVRALGAVGVDNRLRVAEETPPPRLGL